MKTQSPANIAHIVSRVILNAQKLGANEIWLRSKLAPICKIASEPRSVFARELSRGEVDLIYRMLFLLAQRAESISPSSVHFTAPLTDSITLACTYTPSEQMMELHIKLDAAADLSLLAHAVPPRRLDAGAALDGASAV